ncbi:MAG: hypothetical protein RLZZ181_960 [Pseudomonadota bacterium]|jgi:hypothetical protein
MAFTDLSNAQSMQLTNALQVWQGVGSAKSAAFAHRGSMKWRTINGVDYLLHVSPSGSQHSLGPRDPETEKVHDKFTKGKIESEARLKSLKEQLKQAIAVNRALRVGRVPNILIAVLNSIEKAGLKDHFMVIGTNALYAYETQCSTRFDNDVVATQDLDILWDSRKSIKLAVTKEIQEEGLLGVLKKADKSFELISDQKYTAINSEGYMVDLIRRGGQDLMHDEGFPKSLSKVSDDFWAVKIPTADWLLSAPKFREVVFSVNGKMAEMTTVDPRAFVIYKTWLSKKKDREPQKKGRDFAQAQAVADLITQRMPNLDVSQIHALPLDL